MRNHILNLVLFALVITIIGCGSGGSGGGEKQDITVSLSPKAVSVAGDATQQFRATILNPNNTGVTWTLSGSGCSGSACGTLGVANPNSATLTAEYAGNDSGNSIPLGNFTATYSIAVNGRANLIPSSGGVPGFYYYLVGPNKAFVVSDDQNVMTGMVEPQTVPTGGFTNASMLGDYFLGTIDRASSQVIDASGVENLDGMNTWTSMEDASLPGGNYSDLGAAGAYIMTNPATGRGTISVPGGNGIVFYAVSPGKFYNFILDTPDRIAVSEQQ